MLEGRVMYPLIDKPTPFKRRASMQPTIPANQGAFHFDTRDRHEGLSISLFPERTLLSGRMHVREFPTPDPSDP